MVFGLSKKLDRKATVFQSFDDQSCWSGESKSKVDGDGGVDRDSREANCPDSPERLSVVKVTSAMAIFNRKSFSAYRNHFAETKDGSASSSSSDIGTGQKTAASEAESQICRPSILKSPSMEADWGLNDVLDEVKNDPDIQGAMLDDDDDDDTETSYTESEAGELVQLALIAGGCSGADTLEVTMPEEEIVDSVKVNFYGRINDESTVDKKNCESSDGSETGCLRDDSDESEIGCLADESFSDLVRGRNGDFSQFDTPARAIRIEPPATQTFAASQQGVLALIASSRQENPKLAKRRQTPSKTSVSGKKSSEGTKANNVNCDSTVTEKTRNKNGGVDVSKPSNQRRRNKDHSSRSENEKLNSNSSTSTTLNEQCRNGATGKSHDETRDRHDSILRRISPEKGRKPRSSSSDRPKYDDAKPSKTNEDTVADSRASRRRAQQLDSKGCHPSDSNKQTSSRRPSSDAAKEAKPLCELPSSKSNDAPTKSVENDLAAVLAMITPAEPPSNTSQKFHSSTIVLDGIEPPCRSSPKRNPSRRPRKLSSMALLAENIELPDKECSSAMDCSSHSASFATEKQQASQRLSHSMHASPRRRVSRISRFNKPILENGEAPELEKKVSSAFESKLLLATESIKVAIPKEDNHQVSPVAHTRERIVTASALKETLEGNVEQVVETLPEKKSKNHKKPSSKSRDGKKKGETQ